MRPNYRPSTYDTNTTIIRKVRILKIKKLDTFFLVVSDLHHFPASLFPSLVPWEEREEASTSFKSSPAL